MVVNASENINMDNKTTTFAESINYNNSEKSAENQNLMKHKVIYTPTKRLKSLRKGSKSDELHDFDKLTSAEKKKFAKVSLDAKKQNFVIPLNFN